MMSHVDEGAQRTKFDDATPEEKALWDAVFAATCTRVESSPEAHRMASAAILRRRETFPPQPLAMAPVPRMSF